MGIFLEKTFGNDFVVGVLLVPKLLADFSGGLFGGEEFLERVVAFAVEVFWGCFWFLGGFGGFGGWLRGGGRFFRRRCLGGRLVCSSFLSSGLGCRIRSGSFLCSNRFGS